MNNFVVGIDTDGVLIDTPKFYIEEGRTFFRREPVDPNAYSPEDMFGINKFQKILFGLKVLDKYCKKAPLREGVVDTLTKMRQEQVAIHSITARMFTTNSNPLGKYYRSLYEKYIKKQGLNFDSIQYCSEAYSPRDKYMACAKLDVDLMIEDSPDIAYYLAEQGIKVLLFRAPYNKDVAHKNIIPVNNWSEVYDRYVELRSQKEERDNRSINGQAKDCTNYKRHLKNVNINIDAFKRSERRFKLLYYATLLPCTILFKSKIKGRKKIPYQGGFIIASNHLDNLDRFYISRALGNRSFCGLEDSTIKHTIRGRLLNYTGSAIFMDRTSSISKKRGEEQLATQLVNDKIALTFPEEIIKKNDIEGSERIQLTFKLGTVSLAQKTGAAILPVSLYHGKYTYLKIGELQFVNKSDNLIIANDRLANTILSMTTESIKEDQAKQKRK